MSISKLKRWMLERTPEVRSNSLEDKLQQRPQHIAILAQVVDQKAIDDIKAYISKYTKDG